MLNLSHALIFSSLILAPATWAATQIEHRDGMGTVQKVLIDQNNARMETPDSSRYSLFQMKEKKMFAVDTKEKRIVEISLNPPKPANTTAQNTLNTSPPVQAQLLKQGASNEIAGYATLHYQILANSKVCSDDYFSEAAAKLENIQPFIDAMYAMSSARRKTMANMPFIPKDPCMMIGDSLESEYTKLGLPMKSINKDGKLQHEVVSIKTGVNVAPDYFNLPAGFQMMSEAEAMKNMQLEFMKKMDAARQQLNQQNVAPPVPMPPAMPR
ncbi:MAG: hypothetical protein RIS84_1992 [Pseudomonadota bacterium]|jgi:hypothetical protein